MGKAHKIVALVRQRDSSNSPTISASRESSSGRALGATPNKLAPKSGVCLDTIKNVTEVPPATMDPAAAARKQVQTSLLREHFNLAQQQQRNTAQREFLSLPRCTMNAANSSNTETKSSLTKEMCKEPKELKELPPPHKEGMTEDSTWSPSRNKGTKLLQLSWWRQLSEDETNRVESLPEHQKSLDNNVGRYVKESRELEGRSSTSNNNEASGEVTHIRQNAAPLGVGRYVKEARERKARPSTSNKIEISSNITSDSAATNAVDLKGLYKRAFDVRREHGMKQRWRTTAANTHKNTQEEAIHSKPAQVCSRTLVCSQEGKANAQVEGQHQEQDAKKRLQEGTSWTRLFLIVCLLVAMMLLFSLLWVDDTIITVKHANQYYTIATHYYNSIASYRKEPIL